MIASIRQQQRLEEDGLRTLRMRWKDRLDRRRRTIMSKVDPFARFEDELRILMQHEIDLLACDDTLYEEHQAEADRAEQQPPPDPEDEKFPWYDDDLELEEPTPCQRCGRQ